MLGTNIVLKAIVMPMHVYIYIHVAAYARCLKIPQSHTVIATTFLIRRRIIALLSGTIWTACMGVSVLH